MGMDFAALVRYSRTRAVLQRINALENQTQPLSLEVQSLWEKQRFAPNAWSRSTWVQQVGYRQRQVKRPDGPALNVALRAVDGFHLVFGQGVCCVGHSLRWLFFLTDPLWQYAMLAACNTIADLLESHDGVVMSDHHPAHTAFFAGSGYDACLRAVPSGEGEVANLSDLYQIVDAEGTWDSHGYWCFRRALISR